MHRKGTPPSSMVVYVYWETITNGKFTDLS